MEQGESTAESCLCRRRTIRVNPRRIGNYECLASKILRYHPATTKIAFQEASGSRVKQFHHIPGVVYWTSRWRSGTLSGPDVFITKNPVSERPCPGPHGSSPGASNRRANSGASSEEQWLEILPVEDFQSFDSMETVYEQLTFEGLTCSSNAIITLHRSRESLLAGS
jgi:hypothetical protein